MKWMVASFQRLLLYVTVAMALVLGLPTWLAVTRLHHVEHMAERAQDLEQLASNLATLIAHKLRECSRETQQLAQLALSPHAPLGFPDFAVPIRYENGEVRAVLGSHAHWAWTRELVSSITPPDAHQQQIDLFIVNRQGEIIFPESASGPGGAVRVPTMPDPMPATFVRWGEGGVHLTASRAIGGFAQAADPGWKVYVRQAEAQVRARGDALDRAMSQIFLGAALVFVVLAWWVGRYVGRPIQALTAVAQAIAEGRTASFDVRAHTADLDQLCQSLKKMATTLLDNKQELKALNQGLESRVAMRTRELANANEALHALTLQDTLTGLANRLAADQWLSREFKLLQTHQLPYAILAIDIDFFKRINDTHGHATGDAVLRHVATVLQNSVRAGDLVARTGGEEFIVMLPMTFLAAAQEVAEKIRSNVARSPMPPIGYITISIGIALANPADVDTAHALELADQRLYAAKRAGRNRVMPTSD